MSPAWFRMVLNIQCGICPSMLIGTFGTFLPHSYRHANTAVTFPSQSRRAERQRGKVWQYAKVLLEPRVVSLHHQQYLLVGRDACDKMEQPTATGAIGEGSVAVVVMVRWRVRHIFWLTCRVYTTLLARAQDAASHRDINTVPAWCSFMETLTTVSRHPYF